MAYTPPTTFPAEIAFSPPASYVVPSGAGPYEIAFEDAAAPTTDSYRFFLVM